ncbi:MAG: sulfur transferase domain-containing protein [Lysobacterales bacterium]
MSRLLLPLCLLLSLCHCAGVPTASAPPTIAATAEPSTYVADALQHEGVIIAGQPGQADLPSLAEAGVREVFNLRTPGEMERLDFDEAESLQSLGIDYAQHPVGGDDYPWSPALLDAFSAAMASKDGPLLLHCGSGARASQLYAAWLVRERGYRPDEALRTLSPKSGWPLPMEQLLDRPLRLELATPPSQGSFESSRR